MNLQNETSVEPATGAEKAGKFASPSASDCIFSCRLQVLQPQEKKQFCKEMMFYLQL